MMPYRSYSHSRSFSQTVDWVIVGCYLALALFGWLNIYASVQGEDVSSIFDWSCRSGKQAVWIATALVLAAAILFIIPSRVYEPVTPIFYALTLVLLVAVIFLGGNIKGSHSWFTLGSVSFQPAEISKISTSLMLALIMSKSSYKMRGRSFFVTILTILVPMLIIVCEKETGSALVYTGFIFMLYREGLSGWLLAAAGLAIILFIFTLKFSPLVSLLTLGGTITFLDCAFNSKNHLLWAGIAIPLILVCCFLPDAYRVITACVFIGAYVIFSVWKAVSGIRQDYRWATLIVLLCGILLIFSTRFIFDNVLQPHQRARIEVVLGMNDATDDYNVQQSKIAIGSGGLTGKGYCCGTQTAYGYVPEQSTDFIFCTVGEEWGFLGCLLVIGLYVLLIYRIIRDSERSRGAFTRIYGYCVASCFFMHLVINVGMTIGIIPVIGIPLPFFSYGGSSMWGFTIMLFIFVALDRNERKYF